MISGTRGALLAAGLLATSPAVASPPDGGHYVWVPAGATVVMVPTTSARPIDAHATAMFARQDAMMQRMFADMDALFAMPMPDPGQMLRATMQGMPQIAPGSGVVVTSVTMGNGTCSQTISYGYPGDAAQPRVTVSSTGNGCDAVHSSTPITVQQKVPQAVPVPPDATAPSREHVWTIGDPPHPLRTSPPRT